MTATVSEEYKAPPAGGVGRIARITGPVVDVEFPADAMPEQYNLLKTEVELSGEKKNINMEVAMLTPPVGMNLYVLAGATKDRFEEVVLACIPFAICLVVAMVLVMIFPQIATWLPNSVR
jgi:hypothetical protein